MLFKYKAIKAGRVTEGKIEANSHADVISFLKSNEYFPIEVNRADSAEVSFVSAIFNKAGFNDVVNLTRQLAIMLNAGLTLVDAFDILKKQTTKPALLKVIEEIDRNIRSGKSFSEALKSQSGLFSNLYIALVKSGEASGKLSEILLKLAENLEKQREFNGKIKGALIYPVIVVSGMIIVMFIMITFVIPKLLSLYKDFNVQLPLPTQILIIVSSFAAEFWPIIIAVVGGGIFFMRRYLKTKQGKQQFDSLVLRIPFIKDVIKMSVLVDSTRTLSILTSSGVSILDSLSIIIETTDNMVFQNAFISINYQVEKGTSLGQAMSNEGVFPPILVQMTTVGEQTGHLDDTLMRISNYFESESELAVKAMTALIEPLILVVLGIGVGFLVMAVITPIYNLANSF